LQTITEISEGSGSENLKSLPNVIVVGEAAERIDAIEMTEELDPDIVLMELPARHSHSLRAGGRS